MKNIALTLLLCLTVIGQMRSQEFVADSVSTNKFYGLCQSGLMGEMIYVPYFTTNKSQKKNFIIRQISSETLNEDKSTRLEIPETYDLKSSAMGNMGYLLCFYDAAKKEHILMAVSNGNISKKKSLKSNGSEYRLLSSFESFILITIGNKGGYTLEKLDMELDSKWKKSFSPSSGVTWDILSIKSTMEGMEIQRKENKADGAYAFVTHSIQPEEGVEMGQNKISTDEMNLYPTFYTVKEGMKFTGGYFFKNSIYSKQPDGVFISELSMDGIVSNVVTVPFSQVIEGVKNTLGNKLATGNSSIIFTGGTMSHEAQEFVMTGQLVSRKASKDSCVVTIGDFVTVKIGLDGKFKSAMATSVDEQKITLNGDVSNTNILDFGIWLNNAGFMPFKYFAPMPGNPVMGYIALDGGGITTFCFRNIGLENDTLKPICMPVNTEPHPPVQYTFSGTATPPQVPLQNTVLTNGEIPNAFTTFYIFDNLLSIRRMPIESLDKLNVMIMPEEPPMDEPEPEEEHNEEEPQEESEG